MEHDPKIVEIVANDVWSQAGPAARDAWDAAWAAAAWAVRDADRAAWAVIEDEV